MFQKSIQILAVLLFSCSLIFSQSKIQELTVNGGCNYNGESFDTKIYTFESDNAAVEAVDRILEPVGLERNFDIRAADVDNAAAVIFKETRYLLYNQSFIRRVKDVTKTDWAAISIMAHEVGHHLNGHTLIPGGSRPPTELEADSFSGFVLYKMGATLEEAQIAMKTLASEKGTATHPAKRSRLAAIESGWTKAKDQDKTSSTKTPTETKKPTTSRNSVIGKWRGQWSDTGSVFSALLNLESFNDSKNVQGTITWKLERSTNSYSQAKIGLSGVEYVTGRYDSETQMLYLNGYKKDDPYDVIGLDNYRLKLSENGNSLIGASSNYGYWDTRFLLSRE